MCEPRCNADPVSCEKFIFIDHNLKVQCDGNDRCSLSVYPQLYPCCQLLAGLSIDKPNQVITHFSCFLKMDIVLFIKVVVAIVNFILKAKV